MKNQLLNLIRIELMNCDGQDDYEYELWKKIQQIVIAYYKEEEEE